MARAGNIESSRKYAYNSLHAICLATGWAVTVLLYTLHRTVADILLQRKKHANNILKTYMKYNHKTHKVKVKVKVHAPSQRIMPTLSKSRVQMVQCISLYAYVISMYKFIT